MQTNAFQTFRASIIQIGLHGSTLIREDGMSDVVPDVSAMNQPFWLKPGYIGSHHFTAVALRLEKTGSHENTEDPQSADSSSQGNHDTESMDTHDASDSSAVKQKITRTGSLTQDEIATEAASMAYKIISSTLYRSRHASKLQLFHDLTYLFIG